MAIFNVNQNRQFYVVKEVATAENTFSNAVKNETSINLGTIELGQTKDNKQFFFRHMGQGGITRTDLIDVDKVCYAKHTTATKMQRYPKKSTVTLDGTINSGNPIPGQDYILRIQINNYLAPGDACVLIRSAAVHATKEMDTAKKFYDKMVESLNNNFSRDPQDLLKFESTDEGIVIKEVADQPWRLGVLSQEPVNFEVYPTTIKYDGEDVIWAELTDGFIPVTEDKDEDPIGNGRKVADLEYFCMAERGDVFRNMGWPNNIDVKYMVESDKEYDMFDIHYYYSGDGVDNHKSEKDLTIVCEPSVAADVKTMLTTAGITVEE